MTYIIRIAGNRHDDNFYLPLKLTVSYLIGTLLLYQFGPIAWITYKPLLFYALQTLYILFFVWGYRKGIRSSSRPVLSWRECDTQKLLRFLPVFILCSMTLTFLTNMRNYAMNEINFSSIIQRLLLGLRDFGAGYKMKIQQGANLTSRNAFGGYLFTTINLLWSFLDYNVLFLGMLYWKKEKPLLKVLSLSLVFEVILTYLSIGTNIGVFRIVIAVVVFLVIHSQRKSILSIILSMFERKKLPNKRVLLASVLLLLVFLVYFTSTMKARRAFDNWESVSFNIGGIGLNYDSVFLRFLPAFLVIPLISITSYLTQGLYAFSLSLEAPWVPMFGLGGSMWIVDMISKRVDINQFTYQHRIMEAFHWDERVQWASMYTWAGNDISLYGVILLMYVIGYFFALAYRDCMTTENPFARLLVVYFTIMCIFMPANNQIMQNGYSHLAFIGAFVAWLVTTRVRVRI